MENQTANGQAKCEIITEMTSATIRHCEQSGRLCDIYTGIGHLRMVLCDSCITDLIREHQHWRIKEVQ